MSINLEVPIEMIAVPAFGSTGGAVIFLNSQVSLDTDDYNGATYYFEIIVFNGDGASRNVYLRDITGSSDIVTVPVAANVNYERIRSASWTAVASGHRIYAVKLDQVSTANQLQVFAARIVIVQTNATKTRVQVPLVGAQAGSNSSSAYSDSHNSTWGQGATKNFSRYLKSAGVNATIAGAEFESVLYGSTGDNVSNTLWNVTDNLVASASFSVSTTAVAPTLVLSGEVADGTDDFDDGDQFEVYAQRTSTALCYTCRAALYYRLTSCTAAELIWKNSGYRSSSADTHMSTCRVKYDATVLSTPTVYFELTGSSTNTADIAYLRDHDTADIGTDGGNVASSGINFTAAKSRQRTVALTLTDDDRYYTYYDRISGTYTATSTFIIIDCVGTAAEEEQSAIFFGTEF